MIACLIMAFLFLILSIVLFCGKGQWLIAGFNTMSEQEKKQYDTKKLCRAVSFICLVCSVMLFVMAYLGHQVDRGLMKEQNMLVFAIVYITVILVSIIIASIYIDKKAKK
ncbi:MAG: DUF3784 domain-containing protein [Actinomycetota bacterium]|jgi:cytochrome bd-type quinol oxidase subunit 2|nr:DUF3784 domain-containing protein [Actinomycetota bacterium]